MRTTRLTPRRIGRPGLVSVLAVSASALVACSGGSEPPAASNPPSSAEAPSSAASSEAPSSAGSATGGDSAEAPSASVVQATETDFAIELSETELAAGTTTFEVSNDGGATHDLVVETVEGTDVGATKILSPGTSGTVEVALEPGRYVVYCSVGNHRSMGMEAPITVT